MEDSLRECMTNYIAMAQIYIQAKHRNRNYIETDINKDSLKLILWSVKIRFFSTPDIK